MIQKTITYKDIDGVEQSETLLFHLDNNDIVDMLKNGKLQKLSDDLSSDDMSVKTTALENFVDMTYGFRYEEEKIDKKTGARRMVPRFRHATPEEIEEFHKSEAHGELMLSMYTKAGVADSFVAALLLQTTLTKPVNDMA